MRYVGGKHYIARWLERTIIPLTTGYQRYTEPFLGGANSFVVLAKHFEHIAGYDAHPDLILLLQAIGEGWEPPDTISRELYQQLRTQSYSALRGFAGFAASYGGKWFDQYSVKPYDKCNGTFRDFPGETKRALMEHKEVFGRATIENRDYRELRFTAGDVVYCDPPYAGTMGYAGVNQMFLTDEFWSVAEGWNEQGALVFVSEESAPANWVCLASKEVGHRLRTGGECE